jgi:hypothetical protein
MEAVIAEFAPVRVIHYAHGIDDYDTISGHARACDVAFRRPFDTRLRPRRRHDLADGEVMRFDLRTGQITGSVSVRGIADAIVVQQHAAWVATVIAPAARPATGYDVIRIDARTRHRTLLVHIV